MIYERIATQKEEVRYNELLVNSCGLFCLGSPVFLRSGCRSLLLHFIYKSLLHHELENGKERKERIVSLHERRSKFAFVLIPSCGSVSVNARSTDSLVNHVFFGSSSIRPLPGRSVVMFAWPAACLIPKVCLVIGLNRLLFCSKSFDTHDYGCDAACCLHSDFTFSDSSSCVLCDDVTASRELG